MASTSWHITIALGTEGKEVSQEISLGSLPGM
jgi:hypothetical protein